MFRKRATHTGKTYRLAIAGLVALSLAALAVTIWVMNEFLHEQELVSELIQRLPPEGRTPARALAGELRWQFRLSILVALNLVVTVFALVLLSRAYRSSQESLRDIKALAADILSSMDLAVITTDLDGQVTSINRRGVEMLQFNSEPVGCRLAALSDRLPLEAFRKQNLESESPREFQDFSFSRDGTQRTFRAFCQTLHDHEDRDIGNIIQLRDVTERIFIEDRMRRMERYMGLGSLAAGLHHEIKNPLAALSLHVQLLEEELDREAPDSILEMLTVIRTEVARIGVVLEGFRDFASIDRLSPSELNIRSLIGGQVTLIGPKARRQNVAVVVDIADPLPTLWADRVRLEQVLLNLIVNALEAMPGGGTLTIRAFRADTWDRDAVQIEVIDTGPGIAEDLRQRIFDPYFTTKGGGTGMGLALCEKIVRQHNGSLGFRRTEQGTVFEVLLPLDGSAP